MGCVQAKSALSTPERRRFEKLLSDHGYTGRNIHVRRSVGIPPVVREDEGESGGGTKRTPSPSEIERKIDDDMVDGWPRWLVNNIPKEVLAGLVPKSADSYVMIGKVGQGTYSNVYRARDRDTKKIVALKKVRFDTSESESVRFMAREITILQRLDHPNVLKLEGIATSRMQYSLYLVFEFMQSDLARVISRPGERLTEPQIKCYMHQLLSGLQHCHERGILHRDIKGSNLLIDKHGMLKIGDFGLANYFSPNQGRPLTSRVVTLWYRAPELLLGSTDYGIGIDLWSAGCLLAEMFAGRPIMPGRTEIEQLHRIFRICGSPSEEYWKKLKLSTSFRPPQFYESNILESFRDFPSSSLGLLTTLLSLDPSSRGSAASALQSEFFSMSPLACSLSDLPVVYNEESDDSVQPREKNKHKSSKLKKKRRSQLETQTKLEQGEDLANADSRSPLEDDKSGDLVIHSFILSSGTASSSSSSRTNTYGFTSSQSPSPVTSTLSKHSPSTANTNKIMNTPGTHTEHHPLAAKNIMKILSHPANKFSNLGSKEEELELDLMKRSTSMPNIGRLARDLLHEHYGLGE